MNESSPVDQMSIKSQNANYDQYAGRRYERRYCLAARMGFEEDCFKWSDSECLEKFVDWDSPACEGIDLNYLREHGYARLALGTPDDRAPHKKGNFPTPSGKCEFLSATAAKGNFVVPPFRQMYEAFQPGEPLDTLPDYVPPRESATTDPELAKKFP